MFNDLLNHILLIVIIRIDNKNLKQLETNVKRGNRLK